MVRLSSRSLFRLACGASFLAFVLAYANSLDNAFQFDDDHVVERNLYIRRLSNIPLFFEDAKTFSTFPQNATYRPVTSVTLAIDYAIAGGLYVVPYHVTQLILCLLVGVLFFFVTRALLREAWGEQPWQQWAALFSATFFLLHTGNTQPSNYICCRSEQLSAMGLLGAFLLYLRQPRLRRYGLYLLPMAFGAMAKTPAVIFGPLLLIYKVLFEADLSPASLRTKKGRRGVGRAIVTGLPAVIASGAMFKFVEGMNPAGQTYGGASRVQYLWTQAFVWLRYLKLYVLPTGLSADNDQGLLPTWEDPWVLAGVLALVGSLALGVWAARRRQDRLILLGTVWFWAGVAPTSSIFPLAEVTNDHRMYLGWLGLTIAVMSFVFSRGASFLARASNGPVWRGVLTGIAIALLLAHAVGTHYRNQVWYSEEALWGDTIVKSPMNGRAWMNYGRCKMSHGDYPEARKLFDHAATLVPNYSVLAINRGVVTAALGLNAEAEQHFREAQGMIPISGAAPYFYANFLIDQGRATQALPMLEDAIKIDWSDPAPLHLMMELAAARGRTSEVHELAERTLKIGADPVAQQYLAGTPPFTSPKDDAPSWFQTGLTYTNNKHPALAAQAYRMALARDPKYADAWNNLGWSLLLLGFPAEAVPAFENTLKYRAGDQLATNNLIEARKRLGTSATPAMAHP